MPDDDVLRTTLACFDAKDKSLNVNMILFELPYFCEFFLIIIQVFAQFAQTIPFYASAQHIISHLNNVKI